MKNTKTSNLHRWAEVAALLGALFTLAGFFGRDLWYLEFFSYFKLQLAYCFLAYAVLELIVRHPRHAWASLAFCALNALPSALLFLPTGSHAAAVPARAESRMRILQANILTSNTNAPALLNLIAREAPDVVVLEEPDQRWLRDLAPLTNRYPVSASQPRDDNFGVAIYCATNALSAEVIHLSDPEAAPSTLARIAVGGKTLTVVGTHTLAPYNAYMWNGRNRYTLELAKRLRHIDGPLIVAGDFNNTPWSSHLGDFREISGLRDSSQGFGPQPSWPTWAPWWSRIPIDQCFYSPDIRILSKRPGPDIGSDHLPIVIDIAL